MQLDAALIMLLFQNKDIASFTNSTNICTIVVSFAIANIVANLPDNKLIEAV